ncbi:MAG: tRNA uridine-5-carboxymethylaminomethyl(34) synthesis GTPase MnmE, partial [Aquaspirillum sp.]|nr:tRNA uridine-5-carboxymethylaminomethyl(34) synthesis GTPase MnmE [Aquaspirillum sp.]
MSRYPTVTIAAIATAAGRGGVGVIRVSGRDLLPLAHAISGGKTPTPRRALYTDFFAADGSVLDNGLLLYFPAPHSFTGEDVLELQGHGGPVILNMLLRRCVELGCRLAEPGEFTRRAFLNDKIDLAQAESVVDLIDAQSEAAARSAVKSLKGAFSAEIHRLVDELIQLRMLTEATLDFPEEDDVEWLEKAGALARLQQVQQQLDRVLATATQGAMLREGLHVVLIGQPNVGKSSLLNALAGEEIAIVTDIAGTTRDTVREHIVLEGVPLHIIDTAGLRDTEDKVEQIGIERTWQAITRADLALLLVDAAHGLGEAEQAILAKLPPTLPRLLVHNKIDLSGEKATVTELDGIQTVRVSAKQGTGLEGLRQQILQQVGWQG